MQRIEAAIQVLALDSLAARPVRGVRLGSDQTHAALTAWLQVHDGQRWQDYDPETSEPGLADDLLVLWRGSQSWLKVTGAGAATTYLTVRRNQEAGIRAAVERGRLLSPKKPFRDSVVKRGAGETVSW